MKLLFIQTCAPHSSINAQEGIDALLMGSAFAKCSLLFVAEGVLQIVKEQDTNSLGIKNFSRTFRALEDYGIKNIYCASISMEHYDLAPEDLMLKVTVVENQGIQKLLHQHDRILTF